MQPRAGLAQLKLKVGWLNRNGRARQQLEGKAARCAPKTWHRLRKAAVHLATCHAQAQRFAEAYFGDWSCGTDSVCAARAEPREPSARPAEHGTSGQAARFERAERSGPAAMLAYYRPGLGHPDAVALDVIRCYTLILVSASESSHDLLS